MTAPRNLESTSFPALWHEPLIIMICSHSTKLSDPANYPTEEKADTDPELCHYVLCFISRFRALTWWLYHQKERKIKYNFLITGKKCETLYMCASFPVRTTGGLAKADDDQMQVQWEESFICAHDTTAEAFHEAVTHQQRGNVSWLTWWLGPSDFLSWHVWQNVWQRKWELAWGK